VDGGSVLKVEDERKQGKGGGNQGGRRLQGIEKSSGERE